MQRHRFVALVLVLTLVAIACVGDDDDDASGSASASVAEEEAEETTTTLGPDEVFEGAATAATELPARIEEWRNGELDDDELRRHARRAGGAANAAREVASGLDDDDDRKPLATAAAELYFHAAGLVRDALRADDEAARTELMDLALTTGESGLRVDEWAAYVEDPDSVEPQPLPGDTIAPLDRESQPAEEWEDAVEVLDVPFTVDPAADLERQAQRFRGGFDALRDEPDPNTDDGHERAARQRLHWLVKAIACDAARLEITDVASRLSMLALVEAPETEEPVAEDPPADTGDGEEADSEEA